MIRSWHSLRHLSSLVYEIYLACSYNICWLAYLLLMGLDKYLGRTHLRLILLVVGEDHLLRQGLEWHGLNAWLRLRYLVDEDWLEKLLLRDLLMLRDLLNHHWLSIHLPIDDFILDEALLDLWPLHIAQRLDYHTAHTPLHTGPRQGPLLLLLRVSPHNMLRHTIPLLVHNLWNDSTLLMLLWW